jgi:CheY-like chemotaxis protein
MRSGRTILLVEDDVVETRTVERALDEIGIDVPLVVKSDGEEALAWLERTAAGADPAAEAPALILLDLNMPRMTGIEFLRRLKGEPRLRRIPVIVLTTSREASDRVATFELGAAGYIRKPVEFENFVEAMRVIDRYWTLSELP